MTLKKLYGWGFFEKLAKNNPQVGRSINDTVTMLNAGERIVAGSGPNGTAMESAGKGNPLAMIYPPDGSVLIIAPSGIPKNVKHPNAAKLFMEYLLSVEASKIWVTHFNESMRPEVKAGRRREVRRRREDDPADGRGDHQRDSRSDQAVARHVRRCETGA